MKHEDILKTVNRQSGMTVPDGFFEDFAVRMAASLPEQKWETPQNELPRSLWNKVRPYMYMAAMFLGVWCMMKMFNLMRPSNSDLSIENNAILSEAVSNDDFMNDYCLTDIENSDLLEDLYSEGFTPTALSMLDN